MVAHRKVAMRGRDGLQRAAPGEAVVETVLAVPAVTVSVGSAVVE